jgi:hypothetical protein
VLFFGEIVYGIEIYHRNRLVAVDKGIYCEFVHLGQIWGCEEGIGGELDVAAGRLSGVTRRSRSFVVNAVPPAV